MTCDDYLSMLETLPVEELNYGEAREHAAYCHECNRVTRVVAARERNMTMAYAEAYPSSSAVTVAERAIATARRRRIAFFFRAGLGLATVVLLFAFIAFRRVVPDMAAAGVVAQSVNLQCLSPDQASELVRQEIQGHVPLSIRARPRVAVVELEGPPDAVARARHVIDRFDTPRAANCAADVVVPSAARATRATRAVEVVVPPTRVQVVIPATARPEAAAARPAKAVVPKEER